MHSSRLLGLCFKESLRDVSNKKHSANKPYPRLPTLMLAYARLLSITLSIALDLSISLNISEYLNIPQYLAMSISLNFSMSLNISQHLLISQYLTICLTSIFVSWIDGRSQRSRRVKRTICAMLRSGCYPTP